jgi:hypothetical protein
MTNCCDANGNCTQGRDCPIRKQRMGHVETDLYMEALRDSVITVAALIAVCAAVILIFFFYIWGK